MEIVTRIKRWCARDNELQVAHSNGADLVDAQAGFTQQAHDVTQRHMPMSVETSEQALSLARRCREVYSYDASIRLDDSAHFPRALLADWPRKVMQHQRTENDVERRIRKGKRLDDRRFEADLDAGFNGLSLRPFNHLRRGIDTDDGA
jgi:hypothetical protein